MLSFFKKAVQQYPNNIALSWMDELNKNHEITYKELDRLSDKAAERLKCAMPGDLSGSAIVVCLPRDPRWIITALAIWKLGAVYVPLDPHSTGQGFQRLLAVAQECQASAIISHHNLGFQSNFHEDIHNGNESKLYVYPQSEDNSLKIELTVSVETQSEEDQEDKQLALPASLTNQVKRYNDLEYMMPTSGTTGKPKMVPIGRAGLERWEVVLKEQVNIPSDVTVIGFTSAGFDPHLWEWFKAFIVGGKLYLVSEAARQSVDKFVDVINQQTGPVYLTLTPAVINSLRRSTKKINKKLVFFSTGDACTEEIVKWCAENDYEIWNAFGPTEMTWGQSVIKINLDMIHKGIVPIGGSYKPKAGEFNPPLRMFLFDKDALREGEIKIVPEGEEGIIGLAGPGLTEGYLNNSKANQDNFKEFTDDRGKVHRVFITWDLAQKIKNKNYYAYLGRIRSVVEKINGVKVDVAALRIDIKQHTDVDDCEISVVKTAEHSIVMVAHVTLKGKGDDNIDLEWLSEYYSAKIRQHLQRLGHQYKPLKVLVYNKFPQTASFKKDTRKLHYYAEASLKKAIKGVYRDQHLLPIEEKVIAILQEILGIKTLDLDVSFRDLGGNSLKVAILTEKLSETFELADIPIGDLINIDDLTVHKIISIVHRNLPVSTKSVLLAKDADYETRNHGGVEKIAFCLPDISGFSTSYSIFAPLVTKSLKDVSQGSWVIRSLTPPGHEKAIYITRSLEDQAIYYYRQIKQIQKKGPYTIFAWSFAGLLAHKIAELFSNDQQASQVVLLDSYAPSVYHMMPIQFFTTYLQNLLSIITNMCELIYKSSFAKKSKPMKTIGISRQQSSPLRAKRAKVPSKREKKRRSNSAPLSDEDRIIAKINQINFEFSRYLSLYTVENGFNEKICNFFLQLYANLISALRYNPVGFSDEESKQNELSYFSIILASKTLQQLKKCQQEISSESDSQFIGSYGWRVCLKPSQYQILADFKGDHFSVVKSEKVARQVSDYIASHSKTTHQALEQSANQNEEISKLKQMMEQEMAQLRSQVQLLQERVRRYEKANLSELSRLDKSPPSSPGFDYKSLSISNKIKFFIKAKRQGGGNQANDNSPPSVSRGLSPSDDSRANVNKTDCVIL